MRPEVSFPGQRHTTLLCSGSAFRNQCPAGPHRAGASSPDCPSVQHSPQDKGRPRKAPELPQQNAPPLTAEAKMYMKRQNVHVYSDRQLLIYPFSQEPATGSSYFVGFFPSFTEV